MINPSDLKACGAGCDLLFGRHRVGFLAKFNDGDERTNWLGEDILVCSICKRDPSMHSRWRSMYKKSRPWSKGPTARKGDPVEVILLFEDQLVPNESGGSY